MPIFLSLLPSLLPLAGAALTAFSPAIQHAIASHPAVSAVLLQIYAVLTHLLPSPVGGGNK